jgi:predicted ATPase
MRQGRGWRGESRRDDARQMLSAIYGWFTEGFDTPDLQEARALLEELTADEGYIVKGGTPS